MTLQNLEYGFSRHKKLDWSRNYEPERNGNKNYIKNSKSRLPNGWWQDIPIIVRGNEFAIRL